MRIAALIVVVIAIPFARFASAELPPPTDEATAQAAEAAAKAAWSDKTAQYKLCVAMDRTAETYRSRLEASGKEHSGACRNASVHGSGSLRFAGGFRHIEAARSRRRTFAARDRSIPAQHGGRGRRNIEACRAIALRGLATLHWP